MIGKFFLILLAVGFFAHSANASSFVLESLSKEYPTEKHCRIFGKVRNTQSREAAGFVKLKLLDARGDIQCTLSAYINDGDPVSPGQAGPFEYWTNRQNCERAFKVKAFFKDMR